MDKNQITHYLKNKIPDYSSEKKSNKHIFQFSLHVYPFIAKGHLHPFIHNFIEALYEIDQVATGYAKKTIDWLANINKEHFEQVIQILSEVLILRKLASIADPDTIELEPSAVNNGKNPEFRAKIDGIPIAVEVKTASLYEFTNKRQNNFQVISQFNEFDFGILTQTGKIVNSKSLKVKDFLESANEKFEQYKKKEEYKSDYRLLFIVWDDYINEPLGALANPNSGLLTNRSFNKDSNFENVDGVIVLRQVHQFFRNLQFGEVVDYGIEGVHDVFDYINPAIIPIYVQNPAGREIEDSVLENFEAERYIDAEHFHVAEYQYTDFVDWKTGLSISGIYDLPDELRIKVIKFFVDPSREEIPRTYLDISLFDNYNIYTSYKSLMNEYKDIKVVEIELFERLKDFFEIRKSISEGNLIDLKKQDLRRSKTNESYKKVFNRNFLTDLREKCPCNSEIEFENCCYIKLRKFEYVNYYNL